MDLHTCSNFIEGLKDISIFGQVLVFKINGSKIDDNFVECVFQRLKCAVMGPFSVHLHFGHLTSLNLMGGLDDGGNISKPSLYVQRPGYLDLPYCFFSWCILWTR